MDVETRLQRALSDFGAGGAPPGAAKQMLAYLDVVLEWNERLNLTRVTDRDDGVLRHVVDSLAFGFHLARDRTDVSLRVVDLGTGGGFPGVPVAVAFPRCSVTLLDARGKKLRAVRDALSRARIEGVRAIHGRLPELAATVGPADVVLARAVAPLAKLVSAAEPALRPGGVLVAWKADQLGAEEAHEGDAAAARAGMGRLDDLVYTADVPRRLVRYRKDAR